MGALARAGGQQAAEGSQPLTPMLPQLGSGGCQLGRASRRHYHGADSSGWELGVDRGRFCAGAPWAPQRRLGAHARILQGRLRLLRLGAPTGLPAPRNCCRRPPARRPCAALLKRWLQGRGKDFGEVHSSVEAQEMHTSNHSHEFLLPAPVTLSRRRACLRQATPARLRLLRSPAWLRLLSQYW